MTHLFRLFLILWLAAVLVLGCLGSYWISLDWQDTAETRFEVDSTRAIKMLEELSFEQPLGEDEAWEEVESLFELEIVPVLSPTKGELPAETEQIEAGEVRKLSFAGEQRFAIEQLCSIELKGENRPRAAVKLTLLRPVTQSPITLQWWLVWVVSNLLIGGLGLLSYNRFRQLDQRTEALLAPLHKAFEADWEPYVFTLPEVPDIDSRYEPWLRTVQTRLNSILQELQNDCARNDLVFGNLQEGVLALDEQGKILLANKAVLQLLGLNEPYKNRPLLECIRNPNIAKMIKRILGDISAKEETEEVEIAERIIEVEARPLPLDTAGKVGVLLTARDQTVVRRIEAVRRDFVSNASHELKTPLSAIRLYAETLQLGALDDPDSAERFIGNIIEQADRIDNLVGGMLQLSRIQSGSALRIEKFDPSKALEPCIAAARVLAESKEVELIEDIAVDVELKSDRNGFQTIASNLLANAVRYTNEGGQIRISLLKVSTPDTKNFLELKVADTGIGIKEEDLERIFERFYRADQAHAAATGGTGLGLSIVKNLIQGLGGEVQATSQLGEGSTFTVRLPLEN